MSPRGAPIASGLRDKRIRLQNPGTPVPDGDGGYTEGLTDLTPAYVQARITPAAVRDLERVAAGTVVATATHLVTILYHAQVTTKTQIMFDDLVAGKTRTFNVNGVRNPDEANIVLVLTCTELLAPAAA